MGSRLTWATQQDTVTKSKTQNTKPNKAKRSCSLWVCVKHTALGSSVLGSLSCCEATSISQMRLSLPKINEVIPAKRRKTGSCSPASWAVADNSFGTQFRAMRDITHHGVSENEHRCMVYFFSAVPMWG